MRYLSRGPFPVHVAIYVEEPRKWRAELRRLSLDPIEYPPGTAQVVRIAPGNGEAPLYNVILNDLASLNFQQIIGLVAHEVQHVWQYIKEDCLCSEKVGDETEAYVVQWLTQWVIDYLEERKCLVLR